MLLQILVVQIAIDPFSQAQSLKQVASLAQQIHVFSIDGTFQMAFNSSASLSQGAHKSALADCLHHSTQILSKVLAKGATLHVARATHTQCIRSSGSLASPNVNLAASCDMGSLAGSFIQLPNALLNGFGMSIS